jgi:hypothetical protein
MAMRPNWFDEKYTTAMKRATAEQALAKIAKDSKVIKAVRTALAARDKDSQNPHWMGPSRAQVIRVALAEVLQESD